MAQAQVRELATLFLQSPTLRIYSLSSFQKHAKRGNAGFLGGGIPILGSPSLRE
jgi:hypothetical protein